jgi:enamine deaminase RidA (YjgF/YER057c/UK114 family)
MEIKKLSSGAKWESVVGYSRAVKAGNRIIIGGTTAIDENSNIVGKDDAYTQTGYIFKKIEIYVEQFGASLENVIHNKIYVTDISRWEEIGKAHAEFFGNIKPCCTMIEVKGFISPDMLVEIETEALVV